MDQTVVRNEDQSQNVISGGHFCQMYTSEEEHTNLLMPFFINGLTHHYTCVCATDSLTKDDVIHKFESKHFDIQPYLHSGQLVICNSHEMYPKTEEFNADPLLHSFVELCENAIREGYNGLYVSGEAEWALSSEASVKSLLDYESKVNSVTTRHPIFGLCLYNETKISYDIMYELLRVHPEVYVDDVLVQSPYYVLPEVYDGLNKHKVSDEFHRKVLLELKQKELKAREEARLRESHISELELLNHTMVDRELKMVELKHQISDLEKKLTEKNEPVATTNS